MRAPALWLACMMALGAIQEARAANCVVNAPVTTQCVLGNGDSAQVTATGSIAISATTGNTSHAIHSNAGNTQLAMGGITIDGPITTVGVGTNNGYIVNLVKGTAPSSTLPGGITLNASAVGSSRGFYINDFNVGGITIGAMGSLQSGSLAIHVVDGSVISGDVVNNGTIRSNGWTVHLGDGGVATRVTGALTNTGVIYGPGYAIWTESHIANGATNTGAGRIVGNIHMPVVDFQNSGAWFNKSNSDFTDFSTIGAPTVSQVRDFTQDASATLGIAVAGDISGGATAGTHFSQVLANGDATVAGAIAVDVKNDFKTGAACTAVIPGVIVATGTLTANPITVSDNSPDYAFTAVANGNAIDLRVTKSGCGAPPGGAASIPTLGEWSRLLLALLLLGIAGRSLRRR